MPYEYADFFGVPIDTWWSDRLEEVSQQVQEISSSAFSDPNLLSAKLQIIKDRYSLDLAELQTDQISAERHEEELLVVSIPFTGDTDTFEISPSRKVIPSEECNVCPSFLEITIDDNDKARRRIDTFLDQVTYNLRLLRAQFEQLKPQLGTSINAALAKRKQQIEAEKQRDAKLGIPVRDMR